MFDLSKLIKKLPSTIDMSESGLARLVELTAHVSPLPWSLAEHDPGWGFHVCGHTIVPKEAKQEQTANAFFLVSACNALVDLIDEIRILRSALLLVYEWFTETYPKEVFSGFADVDAAVREIRKVLNAIVEDSSRFPIYTSFSATGIVFDKPEAVSTPVNPEPSVCDKPELDPIVKEDEAKSSEKAVRAPAAPGYYLVDEEGNEPDFDEYDIFPVEADVEVKEDPAKHFRKTSVVTRTLGEIEDRLGRKLRVYPRNDNKYRSAISRVDIRLPRRTLVPRFYDSLTHFLESREGHEYLDLTNAKLVATIEECITRSREIEHEAEAIEYETRAILLEELFWRRNDRGSGVDLSTERSRKAAPFPKLALDSEIVTEPF